MSAEHFRDGPRFRAFFGLKLLEEAHRGAGIVTSLVEILQAEVIGFGFVLARELEESHRNEEPCGLAHRESADAARKDQRNRSKLDELALRSLFRSVPSR